MMKSGRIRARRKIGTKRAKKTRQRLVHLANQLLIDNSEVEDIFMKGMEEMPRHARTSNRSEPSAIAPSPFSK